MGLTQKDTSSVPARAEHPQPAAAAHAALDALYRSDWGRIVATLISLVGDFEVAEEAAQEAFATALAQWPSAGIPDLPRAWVIRTAHHKAIDRLRRRSKHDQVVEALASSQLLAELPNYDADHIDDDRLRLICTCCHPALAVDAQVALTLRTVCGLEIEEIARALLVSPPTMTKRLVRARQKIRDAAIPYVVPSLADMPGRLASVCTVIYLIFTEGYAATTGEPLVRADLCTEAIRLARLVRTLTAPHPSSEITALLALMLLHDSRRDARVDEHGELVLLEDQDRSRWNHDQIAEALPLVEEALRGHVGPFAIEAAIAALHCSAARPEDTDWRQIVRLYEVLLDLDPSPIASLNRAVAVAMAEGPERGLAIVDDLAGDAVLDAYYPFHAARADLQRRVGALSKAAKSYEKAISLTTNRCERMFLERRLASLRNAGEVEERA